MRPIEQPTIRPGHREDETIASHPAFAAISIHRISGQTILHGSDFLHQGYLRVRIASAELHRGLSMDRHHEGRGYIEVDLSEAQFAHVISSLNSQPTACTLTMRDGEMIPGLPPPKSRTEQFAGEMRERMDRAARHIRSVVTALGLGKGAKLAERKEMLSELGMAQNDIGSNLGFVATSFDEHMEATVEKAKTEVHAYAMGTVQRMGLEALGIKPVIQLAIERAPEPQGVDGEGSDL